jgi:hypothetical protein
LRRLTRKLMAASGRGLRDLPFLARFGMLQE